MKITEKAINWDNSCFSVDDLSQLSLELFQNLEGFQFDLNLYSMSNFAPLFTEVAETFAPRSIAEIGVFEAKFSEYLIRAHHETCTQFDLVDIQFSDKAIARIEAAAKTHGASATRFEERSEEYLAKNRPIDWYFIDGDHNYETVSRELELIAARNDSKHLIFCHDTGWPCARWDSAYNPKALQRGSEYSEGKLSPFHSEPVAEYGLDFPPIRKSESKHQAGVLTAVEDFLQDNCNYAHIRFVPFFGISLIWNSAAFSPADNARFKGLENDPVLYRSWASKLELNRIMLIAKLQRSGRIWTKQQNYIKTLEAKLEQFRQH